MHTALTFKAIEEDTADEDLASIRTTANRIMEAHEKTAGTWIATGKELKRLKTTLVKDTPRGDNTRIGWVKAAYPRSGKLIWGGMGQRWPSWPLRPVPAATELFRTKLKVSFKYEKGSD